MSIARTVVWQATQWTGLEYFTLVTTSEGFWANSQLVGVYEDAPYAIHYQIHLDDQWNVRDVRIRASLTNKSLIHLTSDGRGQWYDQDGLVLPELAGCIDIDLSLSPFTNTLPIRRLRFLPEQPQSIQVVYIDLSTAKTSPVEQLYTTLSEHRYRFQQPILDFSADLSVDADGLVIEYANLFRRIY